MSSISPLLGGFAGTGPYRLTTPTIDIDASGGLTEVDANTKFATNLPVGMAMLITDVEWVVPMQNAPGQPSVAAQNTSIWQVLGQLTEALARTSVAQNDAVDIDIYFDELGYQTSFATGVGLIEIPFNRQKALERHALRFGYLSIAQNLNLVGSIVPSETVTQNGPEMGIFCRIYYNLLAVNQAQQAYLAQRIQIAGQA